MNNLRTLKKILLFTLVFSFFYSNAQSNLLIQPSEIIKGDYLETYLDLIVHNKEGAVVLKRTKDMKYFLQHLDANMDVDKTKLINLKFNKKPLKLERVIFKGGKLIVYKSFPNREHKKNYLFLQEYDLHSFEAKEELQKIAEVPFEKEKYKGSFEFISSKDDSKHMVFYRKFISKMGAEAYGFTLLDREFKYVSESIVEIPFENEKFRVEDVQIGINGRIYLKGIEFSKTYHANASPVEKYQKNVQRSNYSFGGYSSKRYNSPNYKGHVLIIGDNGELLEDVELNLKNEFITDFVMVLDKNKNVKCLGLYAEQGSFKEKGSFFMELDGESLKVVNHSSQSFQETSKSVGNNLKEKLLNNVSNKIDSDNSNKYDYYLHDVMECDNGSLVFLAEQYYISVTVVHAQNGAGGTQINYVFDNVVIIKIDANGKVQWQNVLSKHQSSINDGGRYSSIVPLLLNNELNIIYNGRGSDIYNERELAGEHKSEKSAKYIIVASANELGNLAKEVLINQKEDPLFMKPMLCELISNQEAILYTNKHRKHKFMRLKLNGEK